MSVSCLSILCQKTLINIKFYIRIAAIRSLCPHINFTRLQIDIPLLIYTIHLMELQNLFVLKINYILTLLQYSKNLI